MHPHLVLYGKAARRALLHIGYESCRAQALSCRRDEVGVLHFDTEVIEASALTKILDQNQFQGRIGNRKVRVAITHFVGIGTEELRIEGDGRSQVIDIEGKLDSRHRWSFRSYIDIRQCVHRPKHIDECQYEFDPSQGASVARKPATSPGCCESVGSSRFDEEDARELAEGFQALADPVRLRLLSIIASSGSEGVCVCDLIAPSGRSQPTVSHHLKILRQAGMVTTEKRGIWAWYFVDPSRVATLKSAL